MSGLNIGLGFLEGLSLIASPCILPVLPIVLSASLDGNKRRPYGIILGFVSSFTLFTLLSRQLVLVLGADPSLVRQVSFILLIVFALILLSSRLSATFARWTQGLSQLGSNATQRVHTPYEGLTGILIGCCIGLVWVPCSGPILAAVLVQSIQQTNTLGGYLTVLAFALGTAIPMLLIALGGNQLMTRVTFFKQHSEWIRKAAGLIIILTVLITAHDTFGPLPGLASQKNPETASTKLSKGLEHPYPAPALTGIQHWINSPPLTISGLKGKVVLVDFWTYSCINCLRTLPYIKRWDAKYRKDGLVIIGVHAPEFEFERNLDNVKHAVDVQGIRYPVAMDSNLQTWQNFNNSYWPAHYLIDKNGTVVYTHFGEGEYEITEKNIQYLLGVKSTVTKSTVSFNSLQSPETYLGYERAQNFGSPETLKPNQPSTFSYPGFLALNQWALTGKWLVGAQHITTQGTDSGLRFNFMAKHVYVVLGTATGKPMNITILLNGKATGKPMTVRHHALYQLLSLPKAQNGLLEIRAASPGLQAYAFTFGS